MTALSQVRRLAWTLPACMFLLLAAACDEEIPEDLLLPETHRHVNGLAVPQPKEFDMFERPDGYTFREEGMIRSPRFLEVSLKDAPPDVAADGRRTLPGGATALYTTVRHDGGMGGPEYELITWRPIGGIWVVVSETLQSEWGEPDFVFVWALIDRVRIEVPGE